jgi:hypothetical protein
MTLDTPHSLDSLLRLAATELPSRHWLEIRVGSGGNVHVDLCRKGIYGHFPEIRGLPVAEQVAFILNEEGVVLTEKGDDR